MNILNQYLMYNSNIICDKYVFKSLIWCALETIDDGYDMIARI